MADTVGTATKLMILEIEWRFLITDMYVKGLGKVSTQKTLNMMKTSQAAVKRGSI